MTRFFQFLTCLVLTCSSAFAQSATEADVAKAMDTLNAAIISGDAQKLNAITGAQLSYGHSNGRLETKAEFVSALVERRSVFVKIEISKQNIVMMGNTAIVRNHLSGDTNTGGKPAHVELDVMYVFRLEGGDWKLIGRQAYKL
ncbi:MAG: nuclear transport factor 2 family protein [Alcaligenaceae bacterium]